MTMRTITHITPRIIIICNQQISRKKQRFLIKKNLQSTKTIKQRQSSIIIKISRATDWIIIFSVSAFFFFFFVIIAALHTALRPHATVMSWCRHIQHKYNFYQWHTKLGSGAKSIAETDGCSWLHVCRGFLFHFDFFFFFFILSVNRQTFAIQARMSAWPHLGIFPPVFILQFCSTGLKLRGSSLQGIGPVVQFWQLLITLQNLVHIYTHDIHHLGEKHTEQCGVIGHQDNMTACKGY